MPRQADPATVLASWRAQAQQLCERAAPSGVARAEQVAGKSGIEVFTAMVPLVRAEGKVIHMATRMATAEGRMTGPDGKLYAHASTTCFIFDT